MARKENLDAPQCEGRTKAGHRCTRDARVNGRCGHHLHEKVRPGALAKKPALDPSSVIDPGDGEKKEGDQSSALFGGLDSSKRENGPACIHWINEQLWTNPDAMDQQTALVMINGIKAVMRATDLGGNKKRPGVRFETVRSRSDADRIIAASDEAATL